VTDSEAKPSQSISQETIMKRFSVSRSAAAVALCTCTVTAFAQSLPPLTVPPAQTFPNAIFPKVAEHLNRAREIAGDDLYPAFMRRCVLSQIYSQYGNSAEDPLQMHPLQVFDNLYFVGQGAVSAWAVKTSAGIVLIDSLNNPTEAENILMAGVRAVGLNPADVKYVIVTHEHGDHYNGARYLQDTYGVQVVASDIAWQSMDNGSATRPRRNITVADGQQWVVGDTVFHFTVTPGHTAGALSTVLPVYDHGRKHMGAIYGGFGIPGSQPNKILQLQSLDKFSHVTRKLDVDVLLANHQTQDLSLYNLDLLKHRRLKKHYDALNAAPGYHPDVPFWHFRDPHPYVVGERTYQRYIDLQQECIRVSAARAGQQLPDEKY
jgi:metallo-beta-lactamase class B